jgi:hypothetical protein
VARMFIVLLTFLTPVYVFSGFVCMWIHLNTRVVTKSVLRGKIT